MAHISNIPPEILNMICQTLSWRDIKNLELVLPFDLFTQSGIRDDVFERTLQMSIKETNSLTMDSVNLKKEFDSHVSQYNSLIRNYQGGSIHSFHSLINNEYEQVMRYEHLIKENHKRVVAIDREVRTFRKYYLNSLAREMYKAALQFPQFAGYVQRRSKPKNSR